jgi:copper chaperone CopZ
MPVQGMFCPECVDRLTATVTGVHGVRRVVMDLSSKQLSPVLVEYDSKASRELIRAAVEAAGFTIAGGQGSDA